MKKTIEEIKKMPNALQVFSVPLTEEEENNHVSCGCGWEASALYVLAHSQEEANEMYRKNPSVAKCADCLVTNDLTNVEKEYIVIATK